MQVSFAELGPAGVLRIHESVGAIDVVETNQVTQSVHPMTPTDTEVAESDAGRSSTIASAVENACSLGWGWNLLDDDLERSAMVVGDRLL